nr:DUF1542 domain-containing protein [Streptococcus sp. 563]
MKYKRTQKRSKQMWQRVEKFSIRKFSFGAASCLIGAITVLGPSSQIASADGITFYEANGDKVTAYAHGESVYKLRGTSTSIYNAFRMDVDTSKYTKENPVITVTLRYNAPDNPNEKAPIFWSGRPFHWFTVPEGTEELGNDYGLTLTNGSEVTNKYTNWSSWESNSRFIHSKYNNNPDAWERHNTTTGETLRKTPFVSLNSEFNKFLGDYNNRWYDNSNMPTQKIMNDLRTQSRSIYVDWEKRAAGTVTVTYTSKVKDPVNTKELTFGMGVYQELNRQQYARVETVKLPVLYKLNELFEPKVPGRTGVVDKTKLTADEVTTIKEKIWTTNDNNESELLSTNKSFKDNLKNGKDSISIDEKTGNATITYKDGSTDTIEGSRLIYEKPKAEKGDTASTKLETDGSPNIKYYTKPIPVENYNVITPDDRDRALESFLSVNLTENGQNYYNSNSNKEVRPGDLKSGANFNSPKFPLRFEFNEKDELKIIRTGLQRIVAVVPKKHLYKQKQEPAFDVATARNEAKKVIGSLDNLYPSEKTGFETRIDGATDREGIERVLNEAQSKANENAVELAKMKKAANDKINALGYLTPAEKDAAINKINSATIKQNDADVDSAITAAKTDTDTDRDATRARLGSVVDTLVKKDLDAARTKAKETINGIPDEDLSPAKKAEYIAAIDKATEVGPVTTDGTILNIVEKAQKEASAKEAARKKAEADKVRQQYKDMIDNIPDLTETEKDEYKKEIDKASNIDEMATIVEFAKLAGERKNAVAEIEKLEHLNNNQKQSFKDLVENSANKEEIENYVSQAKQLNSKMKQLKELAGKANELKATDKYTSAATDKKTAFDKALTAAESVLDKANGADKSISTVENLFKTLETAINELKPGSEKVKVDVDKSLLQEEYAKGETVKKSPAYTKEKDETKKKAYDDALRKAKEILDKSDASQDEVDKALEALESARSSLTGKADEFKLTKKDDKPVPISVDPVVGATNLSSEDKKLVQDKINGIPTGAIVIYKPIVEKDNKKYVSVNVTHENISKEIEIEVVQSEAAKSPLNDPEKVKVNNVDNLSDDEKEAVKAAVKKANPNLNDKDISVDEKGKVTVTYPDTSTNTLEANKTVEAKTELDKAKEQAKADLTAAANKEQAEIEADKTLTEDQKKAEKAKVDEAKKAAESNIDKAGTTDEVAKATEDGKKAIDAVHKTELDKAKEQAKSDLTEAANKEKSEIEADKTLTEDQKKAEKAKVDEAKKAAESNIDKAGTTDEVAKATEDGKKAIDEVHQTELDKAKEQAKSDLTAAANKEQAEIEADKTLTEDQKKAEKAKVDEAKKAAESNIDKAGTTDEVAKATEDGKKAIDAVHKTELDKAKEQAKADLTEAANKEQAEIEADKTLTEDQKKAEKDKVDKAKKAAESNIDKAGTTDEVAKATEAGKKVIDAVHKTNAEQATPNVKDSVTEAGGVPVSVDPSNAPKVAEADKKAITEAVVVPEGQPQPTDKQVKDDGKIVNGTGANEGKKVVVVEVTYGDGSKDEIEVPVRKATDQEKAKADLTKAADAEKAEIDEDNALSKKEKEALKKQVDELKAKHEEKINNATSPEAIASATEKGRQEIAAVHTPQDITETAKRKLTPPKERVKVTDINHLTDEEKEAVKKAIVATNLSLEESEIYVSDKGDVASPKGYLEAEKVVVQALNKPATPVVVADPNHLTNDEKEKVKEAVANANPGLNKDDITVDDKGNVTTKNGDKLLAKDVVTPALNKPTTPVVVGNPNALTEKEKEDIRDAVAAANPGLNKGDVTVDNQGNVKTPKGNLPKEDVVTTVLNKPNKLVEVENPNSLTVKEKEAVKKAIVEANPGLTEDKVKVDDQGNVTTPQGNLPAKDVVTSTLKKPTTPVEVVNPSKLTEPEKSKIVEEIIKNNPDLADKKDKINVDDQGNVETPKGNLPAEDVVTPALKKPTKLVPVKDVHSLTEAEKDAVKDAVVAANPGLNKDDVKVDGQGNVETPRGNLLAGEVVTPALKKPVTPVEVKDPKNLTDAEKDAVKDAVVAANPGLNKDDVKVDGQGNVETPQGNLPAKDVVTPALKKPVTPVGVKDSNNLTDKEKEDVKKAIVEANPGLNKDAVKVDDQGNVETPNGNLPKEDVVVQTAKGQSTNVFKPELDLQTALVSGKVTVEKGKDLADEEILKQLALADGVTAKVISKPTTTETGTKEAEVEVTLADGNKVTVKVPVEVVDSLDTADKDNDLAKAKEDAKKQVEEAAKAKITEIKKDTGLTEEQKQKAEEAINKAKDEANKAIDEASSAGTAKQIADQAKENIGKYDPKADTEVKKPDVTNLDEEKAKAKAEILEEAQKRIDEIKNNKDLSDEAKAKAIEEINKVKDKAIEDINKAQSKDEINAAKEAGIHKINEVQPEGSIASKFNPKVPENKVEVENPAKLSDEEREQVRQNIEGANTFPDGTTVEVKPDGTAVITYKDGSSDTISKDKLVTPANKETGTIASRTEPVIPGKTQVGNTTKLTPEEQAVVKKAVEEANNFPAGTTVEVRPDGTVVITYPDKSVDTITGDKLVEKGSKQETPKVQTDAEKNPAQVPGNFVPVENTHNLTQTEQDTVAAKVKEANPAATDVKVSKDGTATLTYGDGSVNTIPGTSLVVAKDTDNEVATQAAQNPAVVPATTEVGNAHSLTPEEQAAVATKVKQANPTATDVKVSKDGTATLTYSDGSVNTIPGTSLVVQKEETSTQEQPTIAEKTKVIIPANPTKVAEATRLTDAEKEAVKKAVVDANGFGSDVKVEVAGDGTATIVFKDGSAITIPGNQLVAQDPKAQDSTKPTAEKSTVKAPAQRVDVKDITHLTDEEKEKVKVAILQANGSALDGATINVAGDGTATITFPDGSVVTILGKDTVQQSAKGKSVTQEATPEYKPETTPGGDNGGNTGSSDANANAGGGSQAGGQANTGSQNPAQSQASKQLATEKESAKKAIEKAAKDKQDEIKGSPLSDKEKAELLARVEAEKQAALKEIENAKTVEDVKEAETIGVQAIAMVTVPKRPVAPNAAPQATSTPQATAGTMQDVTYQSPAGKQLPNTGSASSAALASLGLVAATSGFALLGRKARRRK